jgi:hypothetical protein
MQIGDGADFDDMDGLADGNGRWNGSTWSGLHGLGRNNGYYNGSAWSDLHGLGRNNGYWNGTTWSDLRGLADGNGSWNPQSGDWSGLADGNGSWNPQSGDWSGLADGNGSFNTMTQQWQGLADGNGVYNTANGAWAGLAQGYLPAVLQTNAGMVPMEGYFGQDDEQAAAKAAGATWSGRVEVKDAATGNYLPILPNGVMVSLMAGSRLISKVKADAGGNAAFMDMIAPANSPLSYMVEADGYETKTVPASSGTVTTISLVRKSALAGMHLGTWLLIAGAAGVIGWNLWKK